MPVISCSAAVSRRVLSEPFLKTPIASKPYRQSVLSLSAVLPWFLTQTDYLVRVIIDVDRNPNEIVTVYRTTKFAKYGG